MDSEKLQPTLNQAINWIIDIRRLGRFLPICDNVCLATYARDISGELIGRFLKELRALNMICLNTNVSMLSAWANSYDYNSPLHPPVRSKCLCWGIWTSGNSPNVVQDIQKGQ